MNMINFSQEYYISWLHYDKLIILICIAILLKII